MSYWLIQSIGIIAVAVSLTIFQINSRNKMLQLGMIAALIYALHFFLLGARTGAAMNLIAAGRSYVYFKTTPDKRHTWILLAIGVVSVLGALLTWQGPLSLLPLLGTLSSGLAFWQTKPKNIRRFALISSPLWFAYNAVSGSYPGMFIEVVMICSNFIGQYRFDYRHNAHTKRRLARPA